MTLADWALVFGATALAVVGFAIPMSRIEARARDRGHGWIVATAVVALVLASWPGYWLGTSILDRISPEQPPEGNR